MKKFIILYALMLLAFTSLFSAEPKAKSDVLSNKAIATFAGGCFWCMQPAFDKLNGVIATTVGYTGGTQKNPTYEEVSDGGTGHCESIEVQYDPAKISYSELLDVFWHNIDPTVLNQQFCDIGTQYRSAIFTHNAEQKKLADDSKSNFAKSGRFKHIFTEVVPASPFYPAEDYHQKYYLKNSVSYKFYRYNCGRDERLEKIWGAAPSH